MDMLLIYAILMTVMCVAAITAMWCAKNILDVLAEVEQEDWPAFRKVLGKHFGGGR